MRYPLFNPSITPVPALHTGSLFVVAASVLALVHASPPSDRRVVDVAQAGDAASEAAHGYIGDSATVGLADGHVFRQARGFMRYAMHTFDDTEVTVACTFIATDDVEHRYDVVVEDSLIATRTLSPSSGAIVVVQIPIPMAVTRGRTNIAVILRAHGGVTPALREIRTIQDHNEVDQLPNISGVAR